MQDPEIVFDAFSLKESDVFLDIGCGAGDYSIRASEMVGDEGVVYAVDNDPKNIEHLNERASSLNIGNLNATRADITKPLPFKDLSIDVCLLSTVLHVPNVKKCGGALLREIFRILKCGGRLIVIECSMDDLSYGPPPDMRISPEDVEEMALRNGFKRIKTIGLGFNYLIELGK
jgi:ubiquinone/menaquinone biosynthesis C-methylase UbiE